MVGNADIQAEQGGERAQQAFGLLQGRPKARCSRCPVSIAMSEYVRDRPRRPVLGGCQAAKASGVTHTVRLPRCWSALSYSGQLRTRGILWRRGSLAL